MIPERTATAPPELQAIWDRVPEMKNCQGRCHTSCGPAPGSGAERKVIEAQGKKLGVEDGMLGAMTCSLLTPDGRCSIYSVRPLICRIWGAAKFLPCPYGCEPERYLSEAEAWQMLCEVAALTNEDPGEGMRVLLEEMGPELAAAWEEETGKPAREAARTGRPIEWREATE